MDDIEKKITDIEDEICEKVRIDNELKQFYFFGKTLDLTSKEFDILQLLVENPGNIISRKTLLENVWGYNYCGDTRAVDIHIRRLRKKIETDPSNPKYILTKWRYGYFYKENA
jgi:two-component system, OmpR family, response regulator VicR